jgi:hypothetical protein
MDLEVGAGLGGSDEPQVDLAVLEPVAVDAVDNPAVPDLGVVNVAGQEYVSFLGLPAR